MSQGREFHTRARAADQGEPRCAADTCKLVEGHDGRHDTHANWNGYAELATQGTTSTSPTLVLETRHQHGGAPMRFDSADDVAHFCAWLTAVATETWPAS